ncbi:sulfotransferase [Kitasatospora sp. MAP5-34]|uniref:sulfotransferase n=1 Tax=Kitasatospora sp. MAP5-34 TaxID=3035102 RepID=UPI002474E6FE|nr:sulfotransferase [Kitasatospora sp. MAP5-34]MDH6574650.1 hypothetical protein [Kitasatospora sp. MAP5-34]
MKSAGTIRTLDEDFGPPGGRPVELVFRTVGERTSALALQLAIRHVRPNRVHLVENVKPFAHAMDRLLQIEHDCSHVVYWDADCLVLEDLRPFLDDNELAYVDAYVRDRFLGRTHCGVHVTRTDLVRRMREVPPAAGDQLNSVLRPESNRRLVARRNFLPEVQLKGFHILHDHFQHYPDIFAKNALRELRSRKSAKRRGLNAAMACWGDAPEFSVARAAIRHARRTVAPDAAPAVVEAYIHELPRTARENVAAIGLPRQPPLTMRELDDALAADSALGTLRRPPKTFALGLPGTGIRSLTMALHELGVDLAGDPLGDGGLAALRRGDGRFPALDHYDGLAGIVPMLSVAGLDARHPGARFILTVGDKETWLRSAERHWSNGPPSEAPPAEQAAYREALRLVLDRLCDPGTAGLGRAQLSRIHDELNAQVRGYFAGRPGDLLVLDLRGGEGWERLAPFLGCEPPAAPFPHERSPAHPQGAY